MNANKNKALISLLLIILTIGLIWSKSSLGKISSGNFADNLDKTLVKSAQNNPYPFYKDFLQSVVIPNSYLFGQMIVWGEALVALAITLSSVYLLKRPQEKLAKLVLIAGLLGGIFLNVNFWLGFSSTNPAVDSLNLLMMAVELIGAYHLASKQGVN